MSDKKERYLIKDRLTGHVDHYGHEETPCDFCYTRHDCKKDEDYCWELDVYNKLKSFEVAMKNGSLVSREKSDD